MLFMFFTIVKSKNINYSRNIILSKNNTVSLTETVDDESISTAINELYNIHQNKNNANIYIYLDTPGGSVDAGNRQRI